MADTAASPPSAESGAAILSEQLSALVLKDEDADAAMADADAANADAASEHQDISELTSALTPTAEPGDMENAAPPNRRPLFSSMREALESSGQVKEEPGGYVIKRHSGRQKHQFRSGESAGKPKYRHPNQRSDKAAAAAPDPDDEADAAGYTVIRRRSSCDESSSSCASAPATSSHSSAGRRNPRASTPARAGKRPQQQQQRPRRSSTSALPQSSSLRAPAAPSTSVPPGFQPQPATSRVLRPPPGLTPAASGWVVKAAAPAERANKIEEPPVAALWPEVTTAGKTQSGWGEAAGLQAPAWAAPTAGSAAPAQAQQREDADDDDLLARLGVTL
ncbi:unnamed protein product [Phytophthora fragariaefolia]|uniref:Unnamed protein product n=1 Tax=Phytophthora fragariaefolia TaxID=1490495 RepID=A0A9W6U4Y1_9STRA|nr:unnamed protein product [Phytophthora fragariaefolia]